MSGTNEVHIFFLSQSKLWVYDYLCMSATVFVFLFYTEWRKEGRSLKIALHLLQDTCTRHCTNKYISHNYNNICNTSCREIIFELPSQYQIYLWWGFPTVRLAFLECLVTKYQVWYDLVSVRRSARICQI